MTKIENLVFSGGGVLGCTYGGVIEELHKQGILKHCTRFAGCSAGSMAACLLAIKTDRAKIMSILKDTDMKAVVYGDNKWYDKIPVFGWGKKLKQLYKYSGMYSGDSLYKWIGDVIEECTGNRQITFRQIYDRYRTELAVVVGNVTLARADWCHPKTTPDLPVIRALRMSMSIPFLFNMWKEPAWTVESGVECLPQPCCFTDGGVFCNYPIHMFDGRYLSMAEEDSFENLLRDMNTPCDLTSDFFFQTASSATLGFKLQANHRPDMSNVWGSYFHDAIPSDKQSKLASEWRKSGFMEELSDNFCGDLILDMMKKGGKSHEWKKAEFRDLTKSLPEASFEKLWKAAAQKNHVTVRSVLKVVETKDFSWMGFVGGVGTVMEMPNVTKFAYQLAASLGFVSTRQWYKDGDDKRTVSIDLKYLRTRDFDLSKADKQYMIDAGAFACRSWHEERSGFKDSVDPVDPAPVSPKSVNTAPPTKKQRGGCCR